MFRRSLLKGVAAGSAATVLSSGTAHAQTPLRIRIQTAVPSASIYFELLKRIRRPRRQDVRRPRQDGDAARRRRRPGVRDPRCGRQGRRRRRLRVDALLVGQESRRGPLLQSDGGRGRRPRPALARRVDLRGRRLRSLPQALQGCAEGQRRAALRPADGTGSARLVQAPDHSTGRLQEDEVPLAAGHHRRDLQGDGRVGRGAAGGEIVPAAQRGVIDAAEWIGPADDLQPRPADGLEALLPAGPAPVDRHRRGPDQQGRSGTSCRRTCRRSSAPRRWRR